MKALLNQMVQSSAVCKGYVVSAMNWTTLTKLIALISSNISPDAKIDAQSSVTQCRTDHADTSLLVSGFVKLQESIPCLSRHRNVPTA